VSTKKITLIAMLTTFALVIFVIEAQIPPLVPINGIKLGLANIITLVTMCTLGKKEALCVLILRVVLGNIFAGSAVSCLYSLSGGLICFFLSAVSLKIFKVDMLWFVSVIGALGHNIGQISVAIILTRTVQIAWYFPILAASAVITGTFTGLCAENILKHAGGYIGKMLGAIK